MGSIITQSTDCTFYSSSSGSYTLATGMTSFPSLLVVPSNLYDGGRKTERKTDEDEYKFVWAER